MIDLNEVKACFNELTDITPISQISGQRDVCWANKGNKKVALKIFKKNIQAESRMDREIVAISKLGSPYVPKVLDFGKKPLAGDECLYVIEEWIEGQLLSELLNGQPIQSLEMVLKLANFLITAVIDFEEKDLVHRDIKPNNLMIGQDGKFWVLDFGIVRHLDLTSLTESAQGFGLGTLGYCAPEQIRNIKVKINSRADLFSVGVVLYQCLNGSNPYTDGKGGHPLRTLKHMETQDLIKLNVHGDHQDEFSEFIVSLTERFPSRRPQSAKEAMEWFSPIYKKLKQK